jgi:hypothetical protein
MESKNIKDMDDAELDEHIRKMLEKKRVIQQQITTVNNEIAGVGVDVLNEYKQST